jgi:hypothetical protein
MPVVVMDGVMDGVMEEEEEGRLGTRGEETGRLAMWWRGPGRTGVF